MTKTEKALNYFSKGFNCSQALLATFSDETGLTEDLFHTMCPHFIASATEIVEKMLLEKK